jgi:FAD/FMN-containing dehydrogenase
VPGELTRTVPMDRRSFLRGAALIGSGLVAGTTAAGCSDGAGPAPSRSGSTAQTTAAGHAGGRPDWPALAGSLSGVLLRPGDAGYPAAGHLYNALISADPAAIAQCGSASDVQRCVDFARRYDVEISVRSGGHSYGGYSSGPGLVVDVTPMHTVSGAAAAAGQAARSGSGIVTVGAGAVLIDAYGALAAQGLLLPGGSCPTVGVAGLALGGGIGVFGRAYGLTCDQIVSVDLVTADGVQRHCSANEHDDLYWACRGGGGGNFGVATAFGFRVHPVPASITLFTLAWPWEAAASVFDAWIRWVPSTPYELWANCQLYSSGSAGSGLVKVTGVFAGSVAACSSALAPLTSAVGTGTTDRFVGPEEYLRATMIEAGCEGEPLAQCAAPVQSPFRTKSTYLGGPLAESGVGALVTALSSLPDSLPGAGGGIVFDAYGGRINAVGAGQTAFVHRDAVACAQYTITFPTATPSPTEAAAAAGWLEHVHEVLAPVSQGSYQNYIDPTLSDWQQAYYGSNLARLRRIKRTYDPDDVFHFAQSIPPAA